METLCVLIATKQVTDDVRNSMDGRFVQPHRAVPQRRPAGAVLRWLRQLVGASDRNRQLDLRSDQSIWGITAP